MAWAQLHTLKIIMGMTADKYMAKFEMLAGRTGFKEAALEHTVMYPSQTSPTHPPMDPDLIQTRIED